MQTPQERRSATEHVTPETGINWRVGYSASQIWVDARVNRFQARFLPGNITQTVTSDMHSDVTCRLKHAEELGGVQQQCGAAGSDPSSGRGGSGIPPAELRAPALNLVSSKVTPTGVAELTQCLTVD